LADVCSPLSDKFTFETRFDLVDVYMTDLLHEKTNTGFWRL